MLAVTGTGLGVAGGIAGNRPDSRRRSAGHPPVLLGRWRFQLAPLTSLAAALAPRSRAQKNGALLPFVFTPDYRTPHKCRGLNPLPAAQFSPREEPFHGPGLKYLSFSKQSTASPLAGQLTLDSPAIQERQESQTSPTRSLTQRKKGVPSPSKPLFECEPNKHVLSVNRRASVSWLKKSPGVWTSQVLLAVCVLLTHQHVHWTVDTIAKTDPGFPKMTRCCQIAASK